MFHETYWIATGLSTLALLVAILAYRRQAGLGLRGTFSISSSLECRDKYVSQVFIENQKDRALTVFAIYLRVGRSFFIELESFEESPMRLGPYESYAKEYGPIDRYVASMRVVDFNPILENRWVWKRLVLATSQGKYVIRRHVRPWNPVWIFFRNHCSAVARPERLKFKGQSIGSNARFVLELRFGDGQEQVFPIFPGDHILYRFQPLQLTAESLASADALKAHLGALKEKGELPCSEFEVFDVDDWRKKRDMPPRKSELLVLPRVGFWAYYVVCRIKTLMSNRKLKRENQRRKSEKTKASEDT